MYYLHSFTITYKVNSEIDLIEIELLNRMLMPMVETARSLEKSPELSGMRRTLRMEHQAVQAPTAQLLESCAPQVTPQSSAMDEKERCSLTVKEMSATATSNPSPCKCLFNCVCQLLHRGHHPGPNIRQGYPSKITKSLYISIFAKFPIFRVLSQVDKVLFGGKWFNQKQPNGIELKAYL